MGRLLNRRAKGQSMAIVGVLLGLGVLIGLVAIAIDGGSALLQRRVMQNAADAGSLAGIQLMGERVLMTSGANCNDPYPTYALTNTLLVNTVTALVAQNRGGAVGGQYGIQIYYHYMNCHATYPDAFDQNPIVANGSYLPDYVDGIKVVSTILNPTTFAKALPVPIENIQASAASAMALFPTCRPQPPGGPGKTLPFTRYRWSFEEELPTKENNLCSPFVFWSGQGDVDGPGNNRIKNKISFNTRSFFEDADPTLTPADTMQQLLTEFDLRNPGPPDFFAADMRGSAVPNGNSASADIDAWIRHRWLGTIMTNTNRIGDPNVLGDWAEVYAAGDHGENVQEPLLHQIQNASDRGYTPISAPWPEGLNWGVAITRTIYLWGEATVPSSTSAQASNVENVCPVGGNCQQCPVACERRVTWENVDIALQGQNPPRPRAQENFERVRFTDAVQIVFYENLNGGLGQPKCPDGGNLQIPNNSSEARGVLPSTQLPGPPPGGGETCPPGWLPGNGVYYRRISP